METSERKAERAIANYNRLRREVFELLGHGCARCGFSDKRALQIDHVKNDGASDHRGDRRITYTSFMRRVISSYRAGERGKYQILCANCNWIKQAEARAR